MVAQRTPIALLVDDEATSRQANQSRLEKLGYVVLLAQGETEALDQARQSAPATIFVHLVATALGNLPLIEALRSDDACRHIAVVVLTDNPHIRDGRARLHAVQREDW